MLKTASRIVRPGSMSILVLIAAAGLLVAGSGHLDRLDVSEATIEGQVQAAGPIQSFARLPLAFVENRGQWEMPARFVARSRGMVAYLSGDAVTLQLETREAEDRVKGVAVRLAFEGASESATLEGEDQQPAIHNFFVGNDPSTWRSEVPGYSRVIYHGLYEGVDLCVREESGSLEYDLLLAPGADLGQVVIRCDGTEGIRVNPDGSLAMETELGSITQQPPMTWYEMASGERQKAACRFRKIDGRRYGFEVPERDMALALVIDPWLEWSTYIGGADDDDVMGVALGPFGEVTVAGITNSPDFPTTAGTYDDSLNGDYDWYVARFSADGSELLWSTYLGGVTTDWPMGVGLDDAGRVIVGGLTFSPDFPTTPGAFQESYGANCDAAVVCLNSQGTQLIYSTYLGGVNYDWIVRFAVRGSGEAFASGYTVSQNFPTTPGSFQETYNGSRDAFVTCLNAGGTELVYSTYLGGTGQEGVHDFRFPENLIYMGMALDASGEVTVGGYTRSPDFPTTPGAFDITYNGNSDGFVTRLDATGSALVYSTFLGGLYGDCVQSVAVDGLGQATVGGYTWSLDFPTTQGAYGPEHNSYPDFNDAFVTRLNEEGSDLLYSTFIGGRNHENTLVLAVEGSGVVIGGGFTVSDDFPTTPYAYDTSYNGGRADAVLFRLSPDGWYLEDLKYSTFIGGPGVDGGEALVLDPVPAYPSVILAGYCQEGFPFTHGAYDTTCVHPAGSDSVDGFVCRFSYFTAGVEEEAGIERAPSIKLGAISPNPTHGRLNYTIDLAREASVQVHVFDVSGRRIQTIIDERLSAGVHDLSARLGNDAGPLPNGVYYLRLDADGVSASRTFVQMR